MRPQRGRTLAQQRRMPSLLRCLPREAARMRPERAWRPRSVSPTAR